jgi:alcohol dehydrogenase class IV
MHHGLANALCLPAVVEFNQSTIPERMDRAHMILDPHAETCADAVRALRERVGLPGGLAVEGISDHDVTKLAAKAFEDACHRSNPRETTQADLTTLYRQSM